MKKLLLIPIFFVSISMFAQENFSKEDAKQLIDTFFDGFHKGDTLIMKSTMAPDIVMQTAYNNKKGEHKISNGDAAGFVKAIGERPADQEWDERLLNYEIQLDGNLAHVWTPYEFWLNGKFSHCGANAFTLAKTHSGWKIIHLIDSRRRESCQTKG